MTFFIFNFLTIERNSSVTIIGYIYIVKAFFEEQLENGLLRLLAIYYYLSDDIIFIVDTKNDNSGISQGYFLSRGPIYDQDDYFILMIPFQEKMLIFMLK